MKYVDVFCGSAYSTSAFCDGVTQLAVQCMLCDRRVLDQLAVLSVTVERCRQNVLCKARH